jgi:hypothetical protein
MIKDKVISEGTSRVFPFIMLPIRVRYLHSLQSSHGGLDVSTVVVVRIKTAAVAVVNVDEGLYNRLRVVLEAE